HWESGDVEANGIRLHYTRTRGKGPALVLAHGVTDDGLCWTPVAQALEGEYDVLMVDARGHGGSDAPATGYDAATQAADLAGVIAGLELHKPVILGHSMGAGTALALAGLYPAVPRAILLEDPPPWWVAAPAPAEEEGRAETRTTAAIYGRSAEEQERAQGMQAWFAGLKRKTREELLAEQRAAAPGWSEAELEPWADSKIRVSPQALNVFNPDAPRAVDWRAILSQITCPALVITADPARGAILNDDGVAALRALVPQLQVVHIPGAGHNIRREQFDRFMKVVRDSLAAQAT
ncbi:MAG TPA: alpha/beta hydrolase, partial [Roseiflexaceae bacterium]|nr:alpha/beta hydrolase [Roseiflexaceae bacterium]